MEILKVYLVFPYRDVQTRFSSKYPTIHAAVLMGWYHRSVMELGVELGTVKSSRAIACISTKAQARILARSASRSWLEHLGGHSKLSLCPLTTITDKVLAPTASLRYRRENACWLPSCSKLEGIE